VSTISLSPRTLRILGAFIISGALMGGAYVISGPSFLSSRLVGAESNEELLREYAAKDSDNDGLPDWQEALYGTDPQKTDTDGDGVSDGDAARSGALTTQRFITDPSAEPIPLDAIPGVSAAPGTLTDEFSRTFFEAYMNSWNGTPLNAEEQEALVQQMLGQFSSKASASLSSSYTSSSVRVANVSVSAYAGAVEALIRQNEVAEDAAHPVLLAEEFIEKENQAALPKLRTLSASYRAIADGLLTIQVPSQLADEHLTLARSFDTLARSTNAIARYEEDPLAVLGALTLVQPSFKEMVLAFRDIGTVILTEGVPAAGDPGALIVTVANLAADL